MFFSLYSNYDSINWSIVAILSLMVETREARIDKVEAKITEFHYEMKDSLSELHSDMAELLKKQSH